MAKSEVSQIGKIESVCALTSYTNPSLEFYLNFNSLLLLGYRLHLGKGKWKGIS